MPSLNADNLVQSISVRFGAAFRINDGEHEYEATPVSLGTGRAFYVRYTTVK